MKRNKFYHALKIGIFLFYILMLFFSVQAGHHISTPLAIGGLIVLVGLYNIIQICIDYRRRTGDNKEFNKFFLRSVILAFLIVGGIIVVTVLRAVYWS